jgi:hypothetical protein
LRVQWEIGGARNTLIQYAATLNDEGLAGFTNNISLRTTFFRLLLTVFVNFFIWSPYQHTIIVKLEKISPLMKPPGQKFSFEKKTQGNEGSLCLLNVYILPNSLYPEHFTDLD